MSALLILNIFICLNALCSKSLAFTDEFGDSDGVGIRDVVEPEVSLHRVTARACPDDQVKP